VREDAGTLKQKQTDSVQMGLRQLEILRPSGEIKVFGESVIGKPAFPQTGPPPLNTRLSLISGMAYIAARKWPSTQSLSITAFVTPDCSATLAISF